MTLALSLLLAAAAAEPAPDSGIATRTPQVPPLAAAGHAAADQERTCGILPPAAPGAMLGATVGRRAYIVAIPRKRRGTAVPDLATASDWTACTHRDARWRTPPRHAPVIAEAQPGVASVGGEAPSWLLDGARIDLHPLAQGVLPGRPLISGSTSWSGPPPLPSR